MINSYYLLVEIFNATDYMPEDTHPYFRRWKFQVIPSPSYLHVHLTRHVVFLANYNSNLRSFIE